MSFRIIYPNLADSDRLDSIAASSEVATLPVEHLQRQERGRIWRTEDATDASITGEWDAVKTINGFALVRHNLSAAATIRLRLFSAVAQGGSTLYDSTAVAQGTDLGWGNFPWGMQAWGGSSIFSSWSYAFSSMWFTAVTTARSFQVDISDSLNPDGYFEAARLVLGEYIELSEDASRGSGWWWEENSRQARTAGGTLRTENYMPFRRWEVKLGYLNETDRASIFDLSRDAGYRKDLFISAHPGETGVKERDAAGLVKIVQMPKITSLQEGYDQHESAIVFEES